MAHSLSPTRHLHTSLQELKDLQPQLYSAAEYSEASFLFNEQKQVVLQNLKDYAVKAIVNTIDHLGTVSYNLEEVLSLQISEISSIGVRVASLTQRLHSCQEHKDLEVLSSQRPIRAGRSYHKHYVLRDVMHGYEEQPKGIGEITIDDSEISQSHPAEHSISPEVAHQMPQSTNRVPSLNIACGSPSSDSSSIIDSPSLFTLKTGDVNHTQSSSMLLSKPIETSSVSFDETFGCHHQGITSSWHRGFLSSLLGRKRN